MKRWQTPCEAQGTVAGGGQALVVGDHDHGDPLLLVETTEQRRAVCPRSPGRGCRWARRPSRARGDCDEGAGHAPPAAARRPTALAGRWLGAVAEAQLLRAAPAPARAPRRSGARAMSSGIITFSRAVNSGSRWWNWNTKPRVRFRNARRRSSSRRSTSSPPTRDGCRLRPVQRAEDVQQRGLPTPDAPVMASISPAGRRSRFTPEHGHVARGRAVALDHLARRSTSAVRSFVAQGFGRIEAGRARAGMDGGQEADEHRARRSRSPRRSGAA